MLDEFLDSRHSLQKPKFVYELAAESIQAQLNSDPISISDLAARRTSDPKERLELEKDIAYAKRQIAKETDTHSLPTPPQEFIPRYVSNLDLPQEVEETALEILNMAESSVLNRSSPTISAGCIYTACQIHDVEIKQVDLADEANISNISIRNTHSDLLKEAEAYDTVSQ